MKGKKIISVLLTTVLLLSVAPLNVFAQSSIGSTSQNTSIGSDVTQGAKTEYAEVKESNKQTEVYLTVEDGEIIASVPTTIIVSGTPNEKGEYTGDYSVGVSGDMSGDKIVVVEPESPTVELQQTGKQNKSASITQEKTEFNATEVANNTTTTGKATATGLTAGTWNGKTNFIIEVRENYTYYSSLELAVQDANNLTTENADVSSKNIDNAKVALRIVDNTAYITLMNDAELSAPIVFSVPANLDMNSKQINYLNGTESCLSNVNTKEFKIYNGTINTLNNKQVIFSSAEKTELSNLVINSKYNTTCSTSDSKIVQIKGDTFISDNLEINGTSEDSLGTIDVHCIDIKECVNSEINNAKINSTIDMKNGFIDGIEYGSQNSLNNSCKINNTDINITSVNGRIRAVYLPANNDASDIVIDNININAVTEYAKSKSTAQDERACIGIINMGDQNTVTIDGAIIVADVLYTNPKASDLEKNGCGINCYVGNLNVNATEDKPVVVYGKQWGLETSGDGVSVIHGGSYSAADHSGYIRGSADIYDAHFYVTGRDKYESGNLDRAYGVYLGGSNTKEHATVNMYRCIVGNPDVTNQLHEHTLTLKKNDKYVPIENINLYDCDLYEGTIEVFNFSQRASGDTRVSCSKVNLYGDTKIYNKSKGLWSKADIAASKNWQTGIVFSSVTGKYNPNMLRYKTLIIYQGADIDTNTGEIRNTYLTEDSGIYDYR